MKKICILTPVKNEEENIEDFLRAVQKLIVNEKEYLFEHILIDNCSTDSTRQIIRRIILDFPHVGAIFNRRDFGSARSQLHALKTVDADAVILIAADFQEPIDLIENFLREWERGHLIVGGIKESSSENFLLYFARSIFYKVLSSISEVKPLEGFIGFGLYDRVVLKELKGIDDSNPYFRGIPTDLGFNIKAIPYHQPLRVRGKSKAPILVLFEVAMNGITSHSKAPIRLASLLGSVFSFLSLMVGIGYFIYKIIFWNEFEIGIAPLIIFITFASSLQILFIGLIGEYIAKINIQVTKRPLVVEEERINYPVKSPLNK